MASRKFCTPLATACAALLFSRVASAPALAPLAFCCSPQNDLYVALGAAHYPRFETPNAAIQNAPSNSAVLLLADEYPRLAVTVDSDALELAQKKNLHLFIEFPSVIPGIAFGPPRSTAWERIVVSSDMFAPALPKLRILAANDCHFLPVTNAPAADLLVARVAGYDTAVYGLPTKDVFPILFELPDKRLIVATTKLSGFVTARFAPARDWAIVWEKILSRLSPGASFHLNVKPVVEAAFQPNAKLPRHFERQAFNEASDWFANSGLLVSPVEKRNLYQALASSVESTTPPLPNAPQGDGSLGILEGYASGIQWDGNQPRRLPLRADCNCESAMVLALDAHLNSNKRDATIASNLLDFVYFNSGICHGERNDPNEPAFGLIGWGDIAPAWLIANYGDDNARAMLATILAGTALKNDRWDERVMRALLANLRTTGKFGFRGDRIDLPSLKQNGWKTYYQADTINYSPHFEAYLWACHLWAYRQTGYEPFLDRARTAIEMTMKVYPNQWRWRDNLERAHMLLCLAWLVRVDDTPEHRQWLAKVAGDLLKYQQLSGAIHERLAHAHGGTHYQVPSSNEEYGTAETPLLQKDGDPVTDQLYTSGFALLGLHEAVGVTHDPQLKHAEDKLAEYLCRIQTRSTKFPYLNGTWFRAFDDHRWEAWASSADVGWGAWSLESGWAQSWTAATLALREQKTTYWDFTAPSRVNVHFAELRKQLGLEE